MKKFMTMMACMVMVLVGGVALAACGTTTLPVSLTKEAVDLGGEVTYQNNDSLKLTKGKEANTFEVTGTANFMTAEQATAWGTEEGAAYVVISFKYTEGASIVYKNAEAGKADKGPYTDEGDFTMIWVVNDAQTSKLVAEVTEKDATEATTYTVTFAGLTVEQTPAE